MLMRWGGRPPIKIEAGFRDKRIDNLRADVVRQFINMRLDIVILHADQQEGLPLESRMLTKLLPQVGNQGRIQPFIEGMAIDSTIRPVMEVLSGTGGKMHQPAKHGQQRDHGPYAAGQLQFNFTSPLGMMIRSPPSRF